jgi:hypothetical protein
MATTEDTTLAIDRLLRQYMPPSHVSRLLDRGVLRGGLQLILEWRRGASRPRRFGHDVLWARRWG